MDKSWIQCNRLSTEYEEGVQKFINFAIKNAARSSVIRCPCVDCGNLSFETPTTVKDHLYMHGFDVKYDNWFWHGEEIRKSSSPQRENHFQQQNIEFDNGNELEMVNDAYKGCCGDPKAFKELLEQAEKPLYLGCTKFTKLSFLVKLFNVKGRFGWSDSSVSALLSVLADAFPKNNEIPTSMYEAKKTMSALGLEYVKIHACPNDCILYRKEYEGLLECPTCGLCRWKKKDGTVDQYRKGVPAKTLWYFPPIPRFKRMFQSSETARDLTWHANERMVDGKLRHPADSPSWKLVDEKWPIFASDPRNLRLALSADGINPHSSLSSTYSCWPIILITYNLPPWLCMKRKFMMLSLLISGPQQPGLDIDVYLQPLIEDLQTLWDVGVEAYDAYKNAYFNLRAVLLWTINDFPAYGNLAGCTVKGYYAYPYCGVETPKCRLKHSGKNVYIGHRLWLPHGHKFRFQAKAFDNSVCDETPPKLLNGEEIFQLVDSIDNRWGKSNSKKRKSANNNDLAWWKKKSIFYNLEYWKHLLVRHQLDVMHIEKNVCENIYGTLLHIPGKSKDGLKSRMDLLEMKIRPTLAPQVKGNNNRTWLPPACHTLTKEEKARFCAALKSIKVPTGYSSNIRNLVSKKDFKLQGLKSHDCHVLMQQLLPIAVRCVLPKHVKEAIIRFCFFFNSLCGTVIDVTMLDELEKNIVETLCLLEKCFPPSFFDIMVHLTIHLVSEVRQCGPVYFRWMYPFERYMKTLKGYVRNRNCPEGCIAESYIAEEALEFCAEYLENMPTIGVPPGHVQNLEIDKPMSGGQMVEVDRTSLDQAHLYVLHNTEEVQPYIREHEDWLQLCHPRKNEKWLQDEHNRTFADWLTDKVNMLIENGDVVTQTIRWLSQGPCPYVFQHPGYDINGFHFVTRDRDLNRVTQNSGVSLVAQTISVASSKDKNPVTSNITYYGVIREIWDLDYVIFRIPIMKCDWVHTRGGVMKDRLGFTLVDLQRMGHKSDPFILVSQANQVFYVPDQLDKKWSVVCQMPRRGKPTQRSEDAVEYPSLTTEFPSADNINSIDDDSEMYARDSKEGIWIGP